MALRGRGWLGLGLGVSAALHVMAVLWLVRLPAVAPAPPPAPGDRREMELIEVQVASVAGRQVSPTTSPRPPRRGSAPSLAPPAPAQQLVLVGPPSEALEAALSAIQPPAPAGGESGGEGAGDGAGEGGGGSGSAGRAPASTEALMARLSAAALRCYPAQAVRFRLSGEARLSFCLGDDGKASSVALARSSGSEVLDRAASECVLPGALPLPGAAGCYELPVRFAARGR